MRRVTDGAAVHSFAYVHTALVRLSFINTLPGRALANKCDGFVGNLIKEWIFYRTTVWEHNQFLRLQAQKQLYIAIVTVIRDETS